MRQVATCSDGVGLEIAGASGPPKAPGAFLFEDGAEVPPEKGRCFESFAAARECAQQRYAERLTKTDPDRADSVARSRGINCIDWRTE